MNPSARAVALVILGLATPAVAGSDLRFATLVADAPRKTVKVP